MKSDRLYRALRTGVVFMAVAFVMACGEKNPDIPDPQPGPGENYRAYTEKTEKSDVKMSEETIFVKDKLSNDFESFDPYSGTITFKNSDLLQKQGIKVGDILYSTDRTDKMPDGYCLRVVSIQESGGKVTYGTESATALEAIDYLNESGVLSAGYYKPEDIRIFGLPEVDESADTRGFTWDAPSVEIKGDKMEFYSDGETTRFSYILFEDGGHSDDLKSSLKIKLSLELQHKMDTETSNIMFDYGKFVFYSMFKVGVSAKLEIGTSLALDSNQESLLSKEQEKMAKERLIGKKFKIAEVPLNFTCSKVIVNPKLIVYGEFKLDLSGKVVVEAGIRDGYYALNVENKGYFIPEFIEYSYLRRVTHFRPFIRMEGKLGFTAMAGFGVGINFEIPSFPVITRDEGNIDSTLTEPSAIGVYFGAELTEDINVVIESDYISGNRKIGIEGRNGEMKLSASIEGKIGLRKKVFAELDWNFWERELIKLPDWDATIYSWTPTPYDLQANVNNDDATVALSWKIPDKNGFFMTSTVNIGLAAWDEVSLSPYAVNLESNSVSFGPAQDGKYYWNVISHAMDGDDFPSDTCSFVIDASKVITGEPEINNGSVTVPVRIQTYNDILERGVVYSSKNEVPLIEEDEVCRYSGEEASFDLTLPQLEHEYWYYVRGYALIAYEGGRKYIYGNICLLPHPPGEKHYEIPEARDLGLSVKWASFNLGATGPEMPGVFFAWGETDPYYSLLTPTSIWKEGKESGYDWPSYQWCNGSSDSITKYNSESLTQLELEDDAAHVHLGDKWRIPTEEEWRELIDNCSLTWTSINGVDGLLATSLKPGYTHSYIFLRTTGAVANNRWYGSGSSGLYWTSGNKTNQKQNAGFYTFDSNSSGLEHGWISRCYGLAIRPVYGDPAPPATGDIEGTEENPWN